MEPAAGRNIPDRGGCDSWVQTVRAGRTRFAARAGPVVAEAGGSRLRPRATSPGVHLEQCVVLGSRRQAEASRPFAERLGRVLRNATLVPEAAAQVAGREAVSLRVHEVGPDRQPALMKNSADENAISVRFIEDDVLAQLKTAKTGGEPIARSPEAWLFSNQVEAIQKTSEVSFSLLLAPGVYRIKKNLGEIGLCLLSQLPGAHALRLSPIRAFS